MKISFYLLLSLLFTILVGCDHNIKKDNNKAIVGIWQNTSNPGSAIEFTKDGDYYLRLNGERLLISDSTIERYSYDPVSEENNLIIYGNQRAGETQAKLVLINPERIKIALLHQGTTVSEAEFTKVKE